MHDDDMARTATVLGPLQRAQQTRDKGINRDLLATIIHIGDAADDFAIG